MTPTGYDNAIHNAAHRAAQLERLRDHAACLGLARDRADALLAQTQGAWAGSTPTDDGFFAAKQLLWTEYEAANPIPGGDPFAKLHTGMAGA
ncbi:hypothetical protein [Kitasatospora sp. NPDC127116]|uniref:hypothetical protein n=1 Tax=Kitasatospora sp. NPDC127116 TaxID=3345367 RepID=UPI0036377D9A